MFRRHHLIKFAKCGSQETGFQQDVARISGNPILLLGFIDSDSELAAYLLRANFNDMGEYKVKGSTIRTKFDWVANQYGERDRFELETEVAKMVSIPPPYMDSSWYSFDIYVAVCELIAQKYFLGNLSKLSILGEDSAEKALSTVYKTFTDQSFKRFIERMPSLHKLFYNQGHTEVEFDEAKKMCHIHHRNKDRYSETDLYIALGFYKKAAEIHKCVNPVCSFIITEGHAMFTLRWE